MPTLPTNSSNVSPGDSHPSQLAIAGRLPLFSLCVIFLLTCTLPPLLVYLHVSSTLAAGLTVAAALAILLVLVNFAVISAHSGNRPLLQARGNSVVLLGVLLALTVIHGVIASQFVPINVHRFALSLIPLTFLISGAIALSYALKTATPRQIDTMARVCFWAFMGIILLRLAHLEPATAAYHKPVFPFSEPSHFALAFGPFYLYRSVTARRKHQLAWLAFGVAVAVTLRSETFLAFTFGAAILCRRLLLLTSVAALAILTTAATHLSYFTSRTDITAHSRNLSVLVYIQGWEFLWRSLVLSRGWGLGFQQLGTFPLHLAITRLIRRYANGTALNTMGGSFVLSKLGSEFGIFGLLLTVAFSALCLTSIAKLRRLAHMQHDTFARCVIVAFGVDMFIRGTGYFYGAALLFLGALLSLSPGYGLLRRHVSKRHGEALILQ